MVLISYETYITYMCQIDSKRDFKVPSRAWKYLVNLGSESKDFFWHEQLNNDFHSYESYICVK